MVHFIEYVSLNFTIYSYRLSRIQYYEFIHFLSGFGGLSLNAPGLYYLGNFIVREDLRNKGVGRKLWKAMLAKAGDTNIALDGAPAMVDWYKDKNGFKFQSFKVWFHNITINEEMKKVTENKYQIIQLSDEHWPSLMEYDHLVYPNFDREKILRAWFADEAVQVFLAMKEGRIVGYGSIHEQSDNVYALRNTYADNEDVLEEILRRMFANLPVGTVARFMLFDGKPMPNYLKSADESKDSARRLFNKAPIESNPDKMWLGTAQII